MQTKNYPKNFGNAKVMEFNKYKNFAAIIFSSLQKLASQLLQPTPLLRSTYKSFTFAAANIVTLPPSPSSFLAALA